MKKAVKSGFYCYRQNNSGGGFDVDHKAGISCYVVIEAHSTGEADQRAEKIGLYFDGCSSGMDCSCCGDRWYRAYGDLDKKPSVYGEEVKKDQPAPVKTHKWVSGPQGYIHYLNGEVVPFWL